MRFSEFHAGLVIDAGSYTVSEQEMLEFALRYDPQPFHVDRAQAANTRWGGLIASGWHTCASAMSLAARNVFAGSRAFASPGVDELRWHAPVRPGDELRLTVTIVSSRLSSSGGSGIVQSQWELHNQAGARVLSLKAVTLCSIEPDASVQAVP